ncbi:MAG TPA: hypothetical protein VMI75_32205 [Polyangiaceae bacterium]|nr:hypothetical protein [Polyangiaceae bacterium]
MGERIVDPEEAVARALVQLEDLEGRKRLGALKILREECDRLIAEALAEQMAEEMMRTPVMTRDGRQNIVKLMRRVIKEARR